MRRQAAFRAHLCRRLDEVACWRVWTGRFPLRRALLNGFLWALRCHAAQLRDRAELRQVQQDLRRALRDQRTRFLATLAQEAEAAPNVEIYARLQKAGLSLFDACVTDLFR